MKKQLFLLLALLLNACIVVAQQPAPSNQCNITITGDFDSECIYDYKEYITDEYPNLMIACKNSSVTYTAYSDIGTATTVSYTWEVYGDVTHTATGNQLAVDWGDDEWGMVVVTVANPYGDTCTEYSRVKLIDNPTVGCATIPAYTVMANGDKVVRVCSGGSVQFIDQSSAGNSDIAGYQWSCTQASSSSTPNYYVGNIIMNDAVTHRVYNNCGCYDEEVIYIEVIAGDNLELSCYGTACENSIIAYHANYPVCNDYHWYVDGGTIIFGQGTDTPVVQWNSPSNGYGVIGLDGNLCDNHACPAMMSVRVPIIHDSLAIEGQTDVCIGEAVQFTLPLYGSTKYDWSITPTIGVDTYLMTHSNEIRLVFNQAGTYHLQCTYRCDFLDCGPYAARPLAITVRPKFDIAGNEQVCVANACNLQTTPAVSADWTAYDLADGNQVVATATGSTFSHTFSHAGRYLITAENASYCGPATFVLTVRDVPPAPTVADLNPDNRHTACPYLGIMLSGTPSEPNYSLVWEPTCTTASPQLHSGDSVTITYQAEVCDVRVYNYDRVLQCQSTDYYVHQVDILTPAHLNIPDNITSCPNSVIFWDDNVIPDQSGEGMLYEWTIEENKQYCASVIGSHLSNTVTLAVNDIQTPASFYVKLTRTFCGNYFTDTNITISVPGHIQHTVGIAGPDTVCVNSSVTYTGSGGNSNAYSWTIANTKYSGSSVSHTFNREGIQHVILQENPFTYCANEEYYNTAVKTVFSCPLPMVQGLSCNYQTGTVSVVPALDPSDYSFSWTFRADAQSNPVALFGPYGYTSYGNPGTYYCTVTDLHTGCSRTVHALFSGTPDMTCNTMTLSGNYNYCTHTLPLSASEHTMNVIWTVSGGECTINKHGNHNRYADITFEDIGIYTVTARVNTIPCYKGRREITVDFIPRLRFQPLCDRILIKNNSQYALPGGRVFFSVTNSCNNDADTISMPVTDTTCLYIPTTPVSGVCSYIFTITGYGTTNNNISYCNYDTVTIGMPSLPSGVPPVTITTSNSYATTKTCDNTPIQLTATLGYPGNIIWTTWGFGDGSSYFTNGNSIFHTFKKPYTYYVNVSVVDNRGCLNSSLNPLSLISINNTLIGSNLNSQPEELCPYIETKDITFTPNNVDNHYTWSTPIINGVNPHPTYHSGWYSVSVINENYCQKEASTFVKFKNAPTAHIYADNFNCCVGDEVGLYGEQGPGSAPMSYSWTITGPGGYPQTYTDSNITFIAPNIPGTYHVTLTVTNTVTSCSSTATDSIIVHTQPAAPTIAVAASDSPCISDAPVHLTASGYTGEVHWSNGDTGPDTYYFTHGRATAYYYDPAIGCPSAKDSIRIHKQPDFDALLTGCYSKCKSFFDYNLPVYGLTDDLQSISWVWNMNNNLIASGSGNYFFSPVQLPLVGAGNYQMSVTYSNGACSEMSPYLVIGDKDMCDCDSVEITYSTSMYLQNCRMFYDVTVTVCNNSTQTYFCFNEIQPGWLTQTVTNLGTTIPKYRNIHPVDCDTFHIVFEAYVTEPIALDFTLVDNYCSNCMKEFNIDLSLGTINCEKETEFIRSYDINYLLSSGVAAYLDFIIDVSSFQNVLALWSEPPMIANYTYDNLTGIIQGLCMVDYATLSQLVAEDSLICFYIIICNGNELCKLKCCITDEVLYEKLLYYGAAANQSKGLYSTGGNGDSDDGSELGDSTPRLMPNPTTGEVNVIGTTDEVVEVLVMDMNGRELATFNNTAKFNISEFPTGSYIVRVKTKPSPGNIDTVSYLKLVKK